MIELSISSILAASAVTIANPSKSALKELGISKVDIGILSISPGFFVVKKAYDWIKQKIRKNEKKDRMYREIIQKQQAAINRQKEINRKLEEELRKSKESNAQNQQAIDRLRKQLQNLEDVLTLLAKAKAQAA